MGQCYAIYNRVRMAEKFAMDEVIADGFTGELGDNKYDAMRHAYWNAVMTRVHGATYPEMQAVLRGMADGDPPQLQICTTAPCS